MRPVLLFFTISLLLFSCVSHKKTVYFQEGEEIVSISKLQTDTALKYRIQPGDILNIDVSSTIASSQDLINQKFEREGGGPFNKAGEGYPVNDRGEIELPLVGKIQVRNLTLDEITDSVKSRLNEYMQFIFVKTTLVNFKITVLGEVEAPGTHNILEENISIFQALGLSGDITEFGNRKNVRIIRKINNETSVITLDVSKKNIISSKYYYLYPNDIVYVEALKAKSFRSNFNIVSLGVSVITLIFVILNYSKNL